MAKDTDKNLKKAQELRDSSSLLSYGIDTTLTDEDRELKGIIQKTIIDTKEKFGERTNGSPINYFNEINFGKAFSELFVSKKDKNNNDHSKELKDSQNFKRMMETDNIDFAALLMEEKTRSILYNNYRIIQKHIPECANALNIYLDNIISPDDFTKLIFNIKYEKDVDEEAMNDVRENIDKLTLKYELEDKSTEIISEALLVGKSYLAVLSIEDELQHMLSQKNILNESTVMPSFKKAILADTDNVSNIILKENVDTTDIQLSVINECIGADLSKDDANEWVANIINNNVEIGSSIELLEERILYESQNLGTGIDIPGTGSTKKKQSTKKADYKPMFVNGSSIRQLAPERVIKLQVDNICYGYYYAESVENTLPQSSYLGLTSGRNVNGTIDMAQNNTVSSTSASSYTPTSNPASQLGVGEQKLRIISDMFLNQISKKIDKDFVRKNKEFKDFIYDLVRQDYIIRKGVKLTYFRPDEVIEFSVDPVYRDITYFAKLYIGILTNNILIKLGRAHDKRIFYVNVGIDAKYEEAINSVIQDIKTKDYKMENLNDFNTLLNLTPGRFDDYFMPVVNGDRPVDIETLSGMDVDMNNDFVEYLKNSMMSGMGVPRNLIDVTSDVDFARSISAMNANFVRSVTKYQKKLTAPFTRLYQKLYQNEYRYIDNAEAENHIDISKIRVQFPSPATLNMSNLTDQLQAADTNADFIASQIAPIKGDGSTEDDRVLLKTKIVKDLISSVDWQKYQEMYDEIAKERIKEKIKNPPQTDVDPYGQGGMY